MDRRVALGASPVSVMRLVVGEGLLLAAIGIGIGLVGAVFSARVVSGMLYGIGPFDLASFAGIPALLLGVAVLSCAIPAWRAMRVDPLMALRLD
jgi:putative ABC transport system permease protein